MTDSALAAALRGIEVEAPGGDWSPVIAAAADAGVLPLVAERASAAGWDEQFIAAMRPHVAAETALSLLRERELRRVLDGLGRSQVVPLLVKGAHLAFTLYASPDRRPSVDVDVLVRDEDRDRTRRCLASLGYEPLPKVTGEVAFGQFQFWRRDEAGAAHTIDVHWRLANPKAFADRISYDELLAGAVTVPRLGANAFAPAAPFALLIACLHRTAHHGTSTRLIWLYDIHLLASSLTARDWDRVVELAVGRSLAPVVLSGLDAATEALATVVPPEVLSTLRAGAAKTDADVFEFLHGEPTRMRVAISDWNRLRNWRLRVRFLRDHLFPSRIYIAHRYGTSAPAAMPFLYGHRIVTGAARWLTGRR